MARKIKFPLEMLNGAQVRTIEELREFFDMKKLLEYYTDGKLLIWLNDRYYENEAAQVRELDSKLPDFKNRLCKILGIECAIDDAIELETVERQIAKLVKLKQYTDDDEIIKNIDAVAFDQDELSTLLDAEKSPIYLCGEYFTIPLNKENIVYIGVQLVQAVIQSDVPVDFHAKGIKFQNIELDEEYKQVELSFKSDASENYRSFSNSFYRSTDTKITAPMPGKVSKIIKKIGDKVAKGTCIMTLEAMKMQNEIGAPVAGFIKSINVTEGESVKPGETMALISQIAPYPNEIHREWPLLGLG